MANFWQTKCINKQSGDVAYDGSSRVADFPNFPVSRGTSTHNTDRCASPAIGVALRKTRAHKGE